MDRTITTRRLYRTADYENIEFTDVITDVPEEIWKNNDASKLLRYLQLVEVEYNFLRYKSLQSKLGKTPTVDKLMELIEEERTRTFDELFQIISPKEDAQEANKLDQEKEDYIYSDNPNEDEGDK